MLPPTHQPKKLKPKHQTTAKPTPSNTALQNDHTCCGVVEERAYAVRERRAKAGPQPWIVLKMMVPVTLGILAYATYVYVARLCVRMIRRDSGAAGSRGTGIALLAVYSVLLLWTLWAYMKVILTPPGFAKDYIQKSQRPYLPPATHETHPSVSTSQGHLWESEREPDEESMRGPSYEEMMQIPRDISGREIRFSVGEMRSGHDVPHSSEPLHERIEEADEEEETQAGVLDAIPIPGRTLSTSSTTAQPTSSLQTHKTLKKTQKPKEPKKYTPKVHVTRRPPSGPILHPAHRYCSVDGIVKPYRAHHCRSCGTCVLKYDHHCPWIGQCVGARNQKFFLNFCQAASVFTLYTFGTMLAYMIVSTKQRGDDIDPQEVVILALSALFALFTTTLQFSHVRQIWYNQTTVESVQIRSMKERETAALQSAFGFCNSSAKMHTRREWDAEWGALNTEGNIWWLGSASRNWTDVMGQNKLGWILPIGRSLSDGLTYPVNPRFDDDGRWRKRAEWPRELR